MRTQLRRAGVPGLDEDTLAALARAHIHTAEQLLLTELSSVCARSGLPRSGVFALQQRVAASAAAVGVSAAALHTRVLADAAIISTGCDAFDALLAGGVYSGELTELVGASATGKTQLCLTTAADVCLRSQCSVAFIDTNGGFSPDRLVAVLRARQPGDADAAATSLARDASRVLSNVHCFRVHDMASLLDVLHDIDTALQELTSEFYLSLRVLILDAVTPILAPVLSGAGIGYILMHDLVRILKRLASVHGLAVLLVNHTVRDDRPALGHAWSYVASTRIGLSASRDHDSADSCVSTACVLKSSRVAAGSRVTYAIDDAGVVSGCDTASLSQLPPSQVSRSQLSSVHYLSPSYQSQQGV